MELMGLRPALIAAAAAATFVLAWTWAGLTFGLPGVMLGWIAGGLLAWLAAGAASIAWSVIALMLLLGWHAHACERIGPLSADPV
jgi:hypothetical protein